MLYIKQFSTLTTVTYLLLIIYLTCVELGPGHPPPHSTPFPGKISKLLNSHDSEFPENRPRTHPSPPWKTKLPMAAPSSKKILNPLMVQYYLFRVLIKDLRYIPRYNYRNKIMTGKVLLFIVLHANILNNRTVQKYFALRRTVIFCLLVLHNYHHNYTVK